MQSWEAPFEGETEQERLSEGAHQERGIVYFLQQPETHSSRLYHRLHGIAPGWSNWTRGRLIDVTPASALDTQRPAEQYLALY
jgi:hypothetical protein